MKALQQKIFFGFSIASLLLAGCGAGQLFGPTITPSATITSTFTPTATPTPTHTPTPTKTLIPTSTPKPTVEEAFGQLAPLDFEYIISTEGYSGAHPPGYKMATFSSFFTGNTRTVKRFDEWSKQDITHTEIQVVFRDTNKAAHALWLSFGSDDFKGNWINLVKGNLSTSKDGSVPDLLKLLSMGSNIQFSFFWDTPAAPPESKWCRDDDPDFCNDYSIIKFYLARGNMEFLQNIRDDQFPKQAVLDDMVIPVESMVFVKPATPPVSTWEPLAELSLYDDFIGTELDTARWQFSAVDSKFAYSVSDGILELHAQTKSEVGYSELRMTRQIAEVQAFEAQIRIPKRGSGQSGFVSMKILGRLQDGREWGTECFVTGLTTATPILGCVANGDEHYSPQAQIQFNRWYTIRIEIDKTTGAIQYSLDGQPIEAYLPEDASDLVKTSFIPLIAVWVNENTELTVQFDNVMIAGP